MYLISNINGPFNAETEEGRGANAAFNLIAKIEEGVEVAKRQAHKFLKGEIELNEALENESFDSLANSYIPYSSFDEEKMQINLKQGLAFASYYLKAVEKISEMTADIPNPDFLSNIISYTDHNITPGIFLAWLIFQDCTDILSGVLSPAEVIKGIMVAESDPDYVMEKINEIYEGFNIEDLEKNFKLPEAIK